MMPQATDSLINHLLSQLESLYFALFDEVSDERQILPDSTRADILAKALGFIELEQNFDSYTQIGRFLQAIGQRRRLEGNLINFTMIAWLMEGGRRAFQIEKELKSWHARLLTKDEKAD